MQEESDPALFPQTCPLCGGAMLDLVGAGRPGFQCHIGHAFTSEQLDHAQIQVIDHALNAAWRTLSEREGFCARLAEAVEREGRTHEAARWRTLREEVRLRSAVLRRLLDYGWALEPGET